MIAYMLSSIFIKEENEKNQINSNWAVLFDENAEISSNSMMIGSHNIVTRRWCFYISGLKALEIEYDRGAKHGIAAMLRCCTSCSRIFSPCGFIFTKTWRSQEPAIRCCPSLDEEDCHTYEKNKCVEYVLNLLLWKWYTAIFPDTRGVTKSLTS